MVPMKNKKLRIYLIILVLSNVLFSTMTAAFRISKNTSAGDVTRKATSTTAALELKSVKSTVSAINNKTGSTTRSKSISENLSTLKTLKGTTAEVKNLHTTTEPTTVSLVHGQSLGQTLKISEKADERVSASPATSNLFTRALFSKIMRTEKSSTSNAATIKLSPTFKQNIPASEQLNLSAVIGRKMLSVTAKYENSLSSIPSLLKTFTTRSTGFVTKTTRLPPSFKSLATSIQSTNGVSVTNAPKTDSNVSRKVIFSSVNVLPSTTASIQATRNPTNHLYKLINGNKNSNVNDNSFGHTQNLGFHNDPLGTVPGSNDKDKSARTTNIKYSNSLSTLQALITTSTVPPKENNSSTTLKSTLPGMGFGSDQETAVKHTSSPHKLIFLLGSSIDDTSKLNKSRILSAEINNENADKPENRMNVSSPQFSNILRLLGPTATPATGVGPSAQNTNIELYSYKKFTSSKTPPSVLSPQARNTNTMSNFSVLHKEENNKHHTTFKSGQAELWPENFVGMLRTMFEHYKGNSNIIIVPISIINHSGNVYLMDKNQRSQSSVGETVTNKSQVYSVTKEFTDYENDVPSTAHLSTTVPTFISGISTEISEPEEFEDDEEPITQKKKFHVDEKYGNTDVGNTEFVSKHKAVIHSKTRESPTKVEILEMGHKANIKPVNSVGTVTVRNLGSSGNLHERHNMYDYEDGVKSHGQERKGVTKTSARRMNISAKENGRFGVDQTDYNDSADETEYPTRTLDENISYKQNFRERKQPSVTEEEISRPYKRRIPQKKERGAFEDIAAPQPSDEMTLDGI